MHSQARAFLQPTRANIHQYQFNNPILYTQGMNTIYRTTIYDNLSIIDTTTKLFFSRVRIGNSKLTHTYQQLECIFDDVPTPYPRGTSL